MREGDLDAVVVVPAGLGAALQPGAPPAQPFQLIVYTDPSQSTVEQHRPAGRRPGRRRHQPGA